jgi:hypothetical protein
MLGSATHPYTQNKLMNNDEKKRKEIYYAAWSCLRKRKSKHFSPSLGYRHELKV